MKCPESQGISLEDNLQLKVVKKEKGDDTLGSSSDDSQYGGVCEGQLPVVGYIKRPDPCNLIIYSLKHETAIHVLRFRSAIIKFQSSLSCTNNKAIVLLREGLL